MENLREHALIPLEQRLGDCIESLNKIDTEIMNLIEQAEITTKKSAESKSKSKSKSKSSKSSKN